VDRGQSDQEFVEAVRARLDVSLTEAGLPFNGVYQGSGPHGETTAVLFEAVAQEFAMRFPDLTMNWAADWMEHTSCVDLWITLHHDDEAIVVDLEGWNLVELATRRGDGQLVEQCTRALSQPGDIVKRVEVIGRVLDLALI